MRFALLTLLLMFAHAAYATPSAAPGYNSDPEEPYKAPDSIGSKDVACPAPAATAPSNRMACTMMGCMDGLMLQTNPGYVWKKGAYRFTFEAEGKTETCTGSLPLRDCDSGSSLNCTATWMQITESGCALPEENQGFGDIWINGWPKSVAVTITRDGEQIAASVFTPQYRSAQPNGAHCGPSCCQATAPLSLTK